LSIVATRRAHLYHYQSLLNNAPYQWVSLGHTKPANIADLALSVVGGGLAVSAAVELGYTFFTRSLDEALDPLILGISSFTLINISRDDPPLDLHHAVPVSLLALALLLLFAARRFLLTGESSERPHRRFKMARKADLVRNTWRSRS